MIMSNNPKTRKEASRLKQQERIDAISRLLSQQSLASSSTVQTTRTTPVIAPTIMTQSIAPPPGPRFSDEDHWNALFGDVEHKRTVYLFIRNQDYRLPNDQTFQKFISNKAQQEYLKSFRKDLISKYSLHDAKEHDWGTAFELEFHIDPKFRGKYWNDITAESEKDKIPII